MISEYAEGTLAFAKDILIHFTNNIAEQSIRMLKVKLKISGCFKTIVTARRFAVIYSYLATCRKNGISEMDAIQAVFEDRVDEIIEKIRANIHKKEEFKKAA
jgi:transposase